MNLGVKDLKNTFIIDIRYPYYIKIRTNLYLI